MTLLKAEQDKDKKLQETLMRKRTASEQWLSETPKSTQWTGKLQHLQASNTGSSTGII
jgi:hypothetical protein